MPITTLTTKRYYDYSSDSNTPQILKAVFEQIREHMASVLYTEETLAVGISRFVLADMVETGWNPKATSQFNVANLKFPFTAYNMGEPSFAREYRSYFQVSGLLYNSNIGKFMRSIPMRMAFPMITFYSNPDDYRVGYKLLYSDQASLSRSYKSIDINGYTALVPIVMTYEISKGSFASEFQEQLRAGNIWDISHTVTAYFQEILLTDSTVYEIDEMIANIKRWSGEDVADSQIIETVTSYTDPVILSSDPVDGEISVPVDNSILITFNVTMSEADVEAGITLNPFFENDTSWDDDSKILLIDPTSNLTSGTLYQIIFDDTCKAFYNDSTISSGVVSFTTEQ